MSIDTVDNQPDRIQQAFDDALARGLSLADRFTMMVTSARAHLGSDKFPSAKKPQAEALTVQFIRSVMETDCIAAGDVATYRQLANAFVIDLQRLEVVPQPQQPTWDEHLSRWCHNGWSTDELSLDKLWVFFPHGRSTQDRIIAQTDEAITLSSGKILTRTDLGLRPIIRRPELRTTGPQAMIGKPIINPQ